MRSLLHPLRGGGLAVALATLVTAGCGLLAAGTAPAVAQGGTLGQLAQASGRYFGSATDNSELDDSAYTAVLGSEFGSITPGNSMKWDTTEPSQGQFNFSGGDAIVQFAQAHNQQVRGHNLVWHSQLPSWVSNLPAGQVQAAMENHITKEAAHYKGEVYSWDVVNEPFNDDGTYRTDAFYNAMGKDYIADALRTAHAADPGAKLYINDYNIDGTGAKADAMYQLASDLKKAGVPLDGIGFQGHLAIQYSFPSNMQQNLQRFADLGLDVAFTELDVRMEMPSDSTKLATQADYYRQVTSACLAVTRCVGITVWDFDDKYSWVPSTFSGQGAADLYDGSRGVRDDQFERVAEVDRLDGQRGGDRVRRVPGVHEGGQHHVDVVYGQRPVRFHGVLVHREGEGRGGQCVGGVQRGDGDDLRVRWRRWHPGHRRGQGAVQEQRQRADGQRHQAGAAPRQHREFRGGSVEGDDPLLLHR